MREVFATALLAGCTLMFVGCGGGSSDAGATANATPADATPGVAPNTPDMTGGARGAEAIDPASSAMPGMAPPPGSADAAGGNPDPGGAIPDPSAPPGSSGAPGFLPSSRGEEESLTIATTGGDGVNPGIGGVPGAVGFSGDAASGGVPVETKPVTLDGLAKLAFQQGRERDAFQFLYAWGLTTDAGAAEVLSNYQWVTGLRRPAMAVRWGVGLQITSPPNFTASPFPIGTQQALAVRGVKRDQPGGAAPDAAGFTGGGEAPLNNEITQYSGELGQKIFAEFQTRMSDGRFGKALQNVPADGDPSVGGAYPGAAGLGFSGADRSGQAFGPPAGADMSGGVRAAGQRPGAPAEILLSAGLTFLGTGSEKDLLERAKKSSLDVLAVFRVKLTVTRGGFTSNEIEIALIDVAKGGKPLFETRRLENLKVQQDRMANRDDGVEKEVKKLFEYIDQNLVVSKIPEKLTADSVKTKRVDALVKVKYDNPLPVLAEIRFYNRNNFLSDEDTLAAFSQIMANDSAAKTLLEGKEDERKQAIEKWVPKG